MTSRIVSDFTFMLPGALIQVIVLAACFLYFAK